MSKRLVKCPHCNDTGLRQCSITCPRTKRTTKGRGWACDVDARMKYGCPLCDFGIESDLKLNKMYEKISNTKFTIDFGGVSREEMERLSKGEGILTLGNVSASKEFWRDLLKYVQKQEENKL